MSLKIFFSSELNASMLVLIQVGMCGKPCVGLERGFDKNGTVQNFPKFEFCLDGFLFFSVAKWVFGIFTVATQNNCERKL